MPLSAKMVGLRFQAAAWVGGVERVTAHSGRAGLASELTSRGASTTKRERRNSRLGRERRGQAPPVVFSALGRHDPPVGWRGERCKMSIDLMDAERDEAHTAVLWSEGQGAPGPR